TMPSRALSVCSSTAIAFDITSTQRSLYPKRAPPSRSVAQFPGSMYPTLTRYAGPANANIRFQTETWDVPTLEWTSARDRDSSAVRLVGNMYLTIVKSWGVLQAPLRIGYRSVSKPELRTVSRFVGMRGRHLLVQADSQPGTNR